MIPFEYTYSRLPSHFYQKLGATQFKNPTLLKWNTKLADRFGLNSLALTDTERAEIFSGKKLWEGAKPLAQAYSGHQFGHFNPSLGDGRALLLGELRDLSGNLFDIHLKGSGKTQFSRGGDGRANLSAVIREYIVSEAMHHLGIPSSRTLAIISTGESVQRESLQPGAILVRVATSHVRIGTFEYFASRNDVEAIRILADFCIDRHCPEISKNSEGYLELYKKIVLGQSSLISKWMAIGFIHGVMNTDNTFISGETLDFGPCAFMENYNPSTVFSSIDRGGRYAFNQQPNIAFWNLSILGECLLCLIEGDKSKATDSLQEILNLYVQVYNKNYFKLLSEKLGFFHFQENDTLLIKEFLNQLQQHDADYTLSFRQLSENIVEKTGHQGIWVQPAMKEWLKKWRYRLLLNNVDNEKIKIKMNSVNPIYIPRNHLVQGAIENAVNQNDFLMFDRLVRAVSDPYNENTIFNDFSMPAKLGERITETFCNT